MTFAALLVEHVMELTVEIALPFAYILLPKSPKNKSLALLFYQYIILQ